MDAHREIEKTQTGTFRAESGMRTWDDVVQRCCGLKWGNPDDEFDALAVPSWQLSSGDTMATHIRVIAGLQLKEKYREPKIVVMAYLKSLYRWCQTP